MAHNANVRQGGPQKVAPRIRGQRIAQSNPQLFDDTSMQQPQYGYVPPDSTYNTGPEYNQYTAPYPTSDHNMPQGSTMPFMPTQFLNDPVVANMAMQYGQTIAGQGTDYVHRNIEKYVSTSKLKYYFAVDTSYVGRKLALVVFPYAHSDWSLRYNQDQPVAPRYDLNAPDLYIPVMAFVTYILLAGVVLGTHNRFSPEQLGITASTALVWAVIEIVVLLLSMYVVNVSTDLKYLDLVSYCGYKYVGMILMLAASLLFSSTGYYIALLYTSASLGFFLVRSMKMAIIPHAVDPESSRHGNKRRMYTLLMVALAQPLLMWWLTRHLV